MMVQNTNKNEELTAIAFHNQSEIFDALYAGNTIIKYKRERVRNHLLKYLKPASNILELNAGTGDDAIFLAMHGHKVHATDIAQGMQDKLVEKIIINNQNSFISTELCSFTNLQQLRNKGPYDHIFSNFAGLNCTEDLQMVLNSFEPLLNPGGIITLVILPRFCLWETALIFKGKFKTATRRFFSRRGRKANIDGNSFTCWYYSPDYIIRSLRTKYDVLELEGLCTIVPPSYMEGFAGKHPRLFNFLTMKENKLKSKWPWKLVGDYFIISLRKK